MSDDLATLFYLARSLLGAPEQRGVFRLGLFKLTSDFYRVRFKL
jgi:hypothetical protein